MEKIKNTIDDFVRSHEESVARDDRTVMLRMLTPDCIRTMGPASLLRAMTPPGVEPPSTFTMDNEAFMAHVQSENHMLIKDTKSTLIESVIDVSNHRAAIRFNNEFKVGTTDILLENVCFLDFTEDGTKICRILEITDTPSVQIMRDAMEAAGKKAAR